MRSGHSKDADQMVKKQHYQMLDKLLCQNKSRIDQALSDLANFNTEQLKTPSIIAKRYQSLLLACDELQYLNLDLRHSLKLEIPSSEDHRMQIQILKRRSEIIRSQSKVDGAGIILRCVTRKKFVDSDCHKSLTFVTITASFGEGKGK